jgi:hypothetical protein
MTNDAAAAALLGWRGAAGGRERWNAMRRSPDFTGDLGTSAISSLCMPADAAITT